LSGSPIKESSTEILLEKIADGISKNLSGQTSNELIRINDYRFIPCQACGKSPEPDYCFFHDEIYPVYERLVDCDIVLFGSPIFFDSVSGQAKSFIDRCHCVRPATCSDAADHPFKKILTKKRLGGIVLVGGHRGEFELGRRVIAGFFKWAEVINCGLVTYESKGWEKGAVINDHSKLNEAKSLGKIIAQKIDSVSL